jgi:multiple sugar transport system ATP-binding protein
MAGVTLDEVTKIYGDGTVAVHDLDLEIADGEFMVLVGPSGCGKTTALRLVAGLESITEGHVWIGDRVVDRMPSKDRDIAMVFQNYALYPHLSVADNLAFSLKLHKMNRAEIRRRVGEAARILGLEDLLDKKPRHLSGGQRQRVAMGRAIVREPQAFLMDEPLSNLDAKLRVQTRAEIARIQRDLGTTTIYVTHDQTEAMTMGDRVAVMKRGVLQQVDKPQGLYENPVNLCVGGFIGSPAMNLVEATLETADGDGLRARFGDEELRVPESTVDAHPRLREHMGRPIVLGIRPENIEDAALERDAADDRRIKGTVELVELMGAEAYVHLTIDAKPVFTEDTRDLVRERAELSEATLAQRAGEEKTDFIARVRPDTRAQEGQVTDFVVDTSRLYFFDLESGLALGNGSSTMRGDGQA